MAQRDWSVGTFGHNQRFKIGRHLASGGCGQVSMCRDTTSRKRLVLKRVNSQMAENDLNRFDRCMDALINEMNVMLHLKQCYPQGHPNLVQIEDCSQEENNEYLVMDYCKGDNLDSIIQSMGGKLDEAMSSRIMYSLAQAIVACHDADVMHGDIKPQNIIIDSGTGNVKLCDFGFSRIMHYRQTCFTVQGTYAFMAPEVFGEASNHSSDVWAAGVTLFYMLSGEYPFGGRTREEVERSVTNMRGRDMGEIFSHEQWESVSQEAKHFIIILLTYSATARPFMSMVFNHKWLKDKYSPPVSKLW